MKLPKKIIAFIASLAMVFSLSAPAFAIPPEAVIAIEMLPFAYELYKDWREAHPDAPISEYPGFNPGGMFGDGFGADRAEAERVYNSYVSDLQTDLGSTTLIDGGVRVYFVPTEITPSSSGTSVVSLSSVGEVPVSGYIAPTNGNKAYCSFSYSNIYAPFPARYISGLDITCNNCVLSNSSVSFSTGSYTSVDSTVAKDGLVLWKLSNQFTPALSINGTTTNLDCTFSFAAYFDFYPLSGESLPTTQNITINSRPTSITGDYGIMGDNGTITKVDGNVIVDESASTIYNPVTNTTTNFTNWSYDYSDRSYNLTTEAGDTITVTYGDENITINEGDTIYNVYYVIPQEQPSDPGTDPGTDHTHTYTDEITKQPTCLLSGVRTYTCSCGDSYTKTVPATGHDWQISQQVPNTYDPETGEQTQTGYTVYTCATCGEQYKSTDGAAPPNSSGGESSGGLGDILSGLLGAVGDVIAGLIEGALTLATKAMEALTGLGDLVSQMIETVLGFFGGFIDFMAAMFPFLPEETFTILNLGLILMIAAAVFRKFLN